MEKYYISTAIAYASGKPHIGNTYEIQTLGRSTLVPGNVTLPSEMETNVQ